MENSNPKKQQIVAMVVAIGENNAIGKNNQLLWHLPADLKHFKSITTGGTVIMGRKTYDSIGKPLPNRKNIIVSKTTHLPASVIEIASSIQDALSLCENEEEVFIIGGAQIYAASIDLTTRIYLTTVHHSFEADVFFPEINIAKWKVLDEEKHEADEKHAYSYTFSTLERL